MKVPESPTLWIAAGLVVVAAVVMAAIFVRARNQETRRGGFKDLLKNPALLDQMAGDQAAWEEAVAEITEQAKSWNDADVKNVVRKFLFESDSGDAGAETRVLRAIPARAQPILLEVLGDPSLREKLLAATKEEGSLPKAPFNRACDALEANPPAEAVSVLAPFLDDPSEYIRQHAALVIASVGSPEIVAPVRKALVDKEDDVRDYACLGLDRAIKERRLDDACRKELFADLQRLVMDGQRATKAPSLLLEFDPARAKEFFLSDAVLTPNCPSLYTVLDGMAGHGTEVPRERLTLLIPKLEERIVRQLDRGEMAYPHDHSLAAALRLLGQHRHADDRALLEERLTHREETVAKGAADAVIAFHGLEGFSLRIWDEEEKGGIASLTLPQRHYFAISILDAEVRNGGLSQYFLNSSGDHWREALDGLKAMGAAQQAAIFKTAITAFGPDGPSTQNRTRQHQLAKLARQDQRLFNDLDVQYYDCKEGMKVIATRYVIANSKAFK